MCPDFVVVHYVRSQNPTQMRLAPDHDMIQTLAADRSDQPFGKAILPRRGWRGRLVPDAHGAQSTCDDGAINAIPVSDHVAGSPSQGNASVIWRATHSAVGFLVTLIQTRSLRSSRTMTNAYECIEQVKTHRGNNEQVHGGDIWGMIAQEGEPSLAWRPASLDHVLGDA